MGRNYGLTRREAAKGMRCNWQFKRDRAALRKTVLTVVITLLAVAFTYAFLTKQKVIEKVAAKLDHTEKLLTSYMTVGAVQDADTIYTCANKAYELPKGI